MRQHRSVLVVVTGSFLMTLAGCAADSTTPSSAPPPPSQTAQTQGETPRPAPGAVQEPGSVQPPPGTDVPAPPTTAGEQGQAAQGEPPSGEIQERGVVPFRPAAPAVGAMPAVGTLPNPVVAFVGTSYTGVNYVSYTAYNFTVTNYAAYPDALFAPAPSLPPCIGNTPGARTWLYIYNQDGTEMTRLCTLSSSSALANVGFWIPTPTFPGPSGLTYVRVVLRDRQTGRDYGSTWVQVGPTTTPPPTILAPMPGTVAPEMTAPIMPRGIEGEQPAEPTPGTPSESAPAPSERPSGTKPQ